MTERFRTVRTAAWCVAACALHLSAPQFAISQESPVSSLFPTQLEDARRVAADENAAQRLLDQYVLQTRTGSGSGPRLGWLSTPFSRVVVYHRDARKAGQTPTSTDVPTEILLPEVLVIATSQPAADTDNAFANVQEIAIGKRVDSGFVDLFLPLRVRQPTARERQLYDLDRTATVAVFDLDALAPLFDAQVPNVVVRVSFDRVAKGTSPPMACKDCVVPVSGSIR